MFSIGIEFSLRPRGLSTTVSVLPGGGRTLSEIVATARSRSRARGRRRPR
jgi:hypothetical protein